MFTIKFSEVPSGADFRFHGRTFTKLGGNMAEDERGWAAVFPEHTEVECDVPPGRSVPDQAPGINEWIWPQPRRTSLRKHRRWGSLTLRTASWPEDDGK